MSEIESSEAAARVSTTTPINREKGALKLRVLKRRQAAAMNKQGSRKAAKPIDWKRSAATFAPIEPAQLRVSDCPVEFHEGSLG
jgi:hypothetical protein